MRARFYLFAEIYPVSQVLDIPMNLTASIEALNLTQLAGALTAVDASLPATLAETESITVFAPINSAFAAIADVVSRFLYGFCYRTKLIERHRL